MVAAEEHKLGEWRARFVAAADKPPAYARESATASESESFG